MRNDDVADGLRIGIYILQTITTGLNVEAQYSKGSCTLLYKYLIVDTAAGLLKGNVSRDCAKRTNLSTVRLGTGLNLDLRQSIRLALLHDSRI